MFVGSRQLIITAGTIEITVAKRYFFVSPKQKDFLKKSYSLTNKTRAIERLETAKAINVPWNDKYGTKRQFNTTFKTKPAKCATIIDVVLF